jgi:uncharacterized protein YdiU (UPF0061 family)
VIADVEAGLSEKLEHWLHILSSPFEEHEAFNEYSLPTPPALKNMEVSCSS